MHTSHGETMGFFKYFAVAFLAVSATNAFTCPNDGSTFYHADVSTGCRVYHLCENSELQTLTCPTGEAFNFHTSRCEDASTFHCHETGHGHHVHKRSTEEINSISIETAKNALIKFVKEVRPLIREALMEVVPTLYEKVRNDYYPILKSAVEDVLPIIRQKLIPHALKAMEYARKMSARIIEKAYKSYELSNSTHINIVSFSDVAHDVSNDIEPIVKLGRYFSSRLLQQTRPKRDTSNEEEREMRHKREIPDMFLGLMEPVLESIYVSIEQMFSGNEKTLMSKLILPSIYEITQDPESVFNIKKIFWSAQASFAPLISEMLSMQTFSTPEGTVISIPTASIEAAMHKFQTETKPIINKVVRKHLPSILRRAATLENLIIDAVDRLIQASASRLGLLNDNLLNFIPKHRSVIKTSNSTHTNTYTYTEIKKDLKPIKITLFQILLDYLSRLQDSWINLFFNKDSILYRRLLDNEPKYAIPAANE